MSLLLHKEKGVNPYMTYCPRCGGDGPELLLLGAVHEKYTCPSCGTLHIGRPDKGQCARCANRYQTGQQWKVEEIGESEKLPGSICDKCKENVKQLKEEVEAGGVYWRCIDCKAEGAIKRDHPFAKAVRDQGNIQPPDPVGVEFSKEDCPLCSEHAKADKVTEENLAPAGG